MMNDDDREYIVPRYKVIVTYDIVATDVTRYRQFVQSELIPAMRDMEVYMTEAWHTAYGSHPLRMASFVAEDYETIDDMLHSEEWIMLEDKLMDFVTNFSLKIVPYRNHFQFICN